MAPKSHEDVFFCFYLEVIRNTVFMQCTKKWPKSFSGNSGKNSSHPKNLPAPVPMFQNLVQVIRNTAENIFSDKSNVVKRFLLCVDYLFG